MYHGRRTGGTAGPDSGGRGWRKPRPGRAAAAVTTVVGFLVASFAVLLSAAPVAAAAPAPARPANAGVQVTLHCAASVFGTHNFDAGTQTPTVNMTAPATVVKGNNFTVTAAPGEQTIPTSVSGFDVANISDFYFRFAIPSGVAFVSAVVNNDGQGSYGAQPTVKATTESGVYLLEYNAPGPIAAGTTFTFPSVTATFTATGAIGTALDVAFTGSATTASPPVLTPPYGLSLTANLTNNIVAPTDCAEADPPGPTALASTQIVGQPTSTSIGATPNTVNVGGQVTLSSNVTSTAQGTPTGTVTYTDITGGGSKVLGTATLSGGAASTQVDMNDAGVRTITATYNGDNTFAGSTSSSTNVTVNVPGKTNTTTSLDASPTTVDQGGQVTFSSTVTPTEGSGTPSGTVTFTDVTGGGSTVLGTGTLENGSVSKQLTMNTAGQRTITATYGGDDSFAGSTSTQAIVNVTSTNSAIATSLYRAVLGREPDSTGLTYWTGQLDNGVSPSTVAVLLAWSSEGISHEVEANYDLALHRDADTGGLAFWAGWLANSHAPHTLLAALQGSTEFYANASNDPTKFVTALYSQLLDREKPDSDGLNYWLGQLSSGQSRAEVALRIAYTSEAAEAAATSTSANVCGTAATGSALTALEQAYLMPGMGQTLLRGLAALQPGCTVSGPVGPPPLPA